MISRSLVAVAIPNWCRIGLNKAKFNQQIEVKLSNRRSLLRLSQLVDMDHLDVASKYSLMITALIWQFLVKIRSI
jgi:hypothetical protein